MKTKHFNFYTYEKTAALLLAGILFFTSLVALLIQNDSKVYATETTNSLEADIYVNLSDFTMTVDGETNEIKTYTLDDYDTFLQDYESGSLADIYITEFLFDGVSTVYKRTLNDDLTALEDNDLIEANVININTVANIEFSGTAKKTTIAVNTNDKEGDINLMLNNVTLTSKNTLPAIFAYNKDTSYDACKVTIYSMAGTTNNVTGGRLKKVSLMDKDNLDQYASYSSDYTNSDLSAYYGVYSASDIENVLFATETADQEGIQDGDPLYYYKYSGAISSDIALYFAGSGSLNITSTKKEGVESKGDIIFEGGEGDYTITAYDDCLNASTNETDISISVNSMTCNCAIEYEENDNGELVADSEAEGDGIDSNGTIHIYKGLIVTRGCETSPDSGLDSNDGIYINGGTICSTGNMLDAISEESSQAYMILSFSQTVEAGTTIVLTDENENVVMAYTTDRAYQSIVLSSASLAEDTTYHLYKDGEIEGTVFEGYYMEVSSYTAGTMQQYTSNSSDSFGMGGMPTGEAPTGEMPTGEIPSGEIPSGEIPSGEIPSGEMPSGETGTMPGAEVPSGELPSAEATTTTESETTASTEPLLLAAATTDIITAGSTDFVLTSSIHSFSGISDAVLTSTEVAADTDEVTADSDNAEATTESTADSTSTASTTSDSDSTTDSSEVAADTDNVSTGDGANTWVYILVGVFAAIIIIGMLSMDFILKKVDKK